MKRECVPDAVDMSPLECSSLLELHFQPDLDHDPSPYYAKLSLVYLSLLYEVGPNLLYHLDQQGIRYVTSAHFLYFLGFQFLIEQLLLQVFDYDGFHYIEGLEFPVL